MNRCIPMVLDEGTAGSNDQAVAICSSMWERAVDDGKTTMKPSITIPLEIKALSDREFEGHGSTFGNVDLGGDIVMPGAFKRSLAAHRKAGSLPQMFWMHDPSRVPGKWTEMHEDKDGLAVKGVLAPTELGNEIHTLLKMEAVRGLSIGYVTKDQDFDDDGNRLIKEVELWEVSVVSLPMNPLAQVAHVKAGLSAAGEYVPSPKEFERILRDAGCSRAVAKRIVSLCKSLDDVEPDVTLAPPPRDVGQDGEERAALAIADRIMADCIRRRFAA